MFNEKFEVIWGSVVPFDKPEKRLFMVYYGLLILGTFVGWGFLMSKDEKPSARRRLFYEQWKTV